MIAEELHIDKDTFKKLFHQEEYPVIIKSDFERIQPILPSGFIDDL